MQKVSYINYATPVLLGVLIFSSDFLNTSLFNFGEQNFAVWFVLSILCFACGWYINKIFGWHRGGKIVFAVIIGITVFSMFIVTFFGSYFAANELLTENLILYSLRNITLGAMSFFGMSVQEVINNRKNSAELEKQVGILERETEVVKKEAELIIKEAAVKAEKIVNEAQAKANQIIQTKESVEQELRELIQTEKELIKQYEDKK
ncbi:MAG: hypothetical protein PVF17_06075 [Ignavibacteria bacterium]|jgi:hypothetical protein